MSGMFQSMGVGIKSKVLDSDKLVSILSLLLILGIIYGFILVLSYPFREARQFLTETENFENSYEIVYETRLDGRRPGLFEEIYNNLQNSYARSMLIKYKAMMEEVIPSRPFKDALKTEEPPKLKKKETVAKVKQTCAKLKPSGVQRFFTGITKRLHKSNETTNEIQGVRKSEQSETTNEPEEPFCPICLEKFSDDSVVKNLPCDHCFHDECIQYWLFPPETDNQTSNIANHSCPYCRFDIYFYVLSNYDHKSK